MAEGDWITEALVQLTRSPVWRTPVNNFVDDNCGVFDNDDEMKFEYTTIHNNFKKLLDGLFTDFVGELGISLEDAFGAVKGSLKDKRSLTHRPLEKLLKYIYMIEDFRSFHRMMVKRNIELDILTTNALLSQGVQLSTGSTRELEAMLLNMEGSNPHRARAMQANGNIDDDTAIRNAVAASLQEQVVEKQRVDLEEAQLKEALALSVQAEESKAILSAMEVEEEVKAVAATDVKAAAELRSKKLAAIQQKKELNIQRLTTHTMEALRQNSVRMRETVKTNTIVSPPSATLVESPDPQAVDDEEDVEAPSQAPLHAQQAVAVPAPPPAATHASPAQGAAAANAVPPPPPSAAKTAPPQAPAAAPQAHAAAQVPAQVPAAAPAVPAPAAAPAAAAAAAAAAPAARAPAPAPVASKSKALPPIQRQQQPLRPLPAGAPAAGPANPAPAAAKTTGYSSRDRPTLEQLHERAEHMREQRAKIVAQNKAQRQQELQDYASTAGTAPPTAEASPDDAAQKQLTVDIARRFREDMVRESAKP